MSRFHPFFSCRISFYTKECSLYYIVRSFRQKEPSFYWNQIIKSTKFSERYVSRSISYTKQNRENQIKWTWVKDLILRWWLNKSFLDLGISVIASSKFVKGSDAQWGIHTQWKFILWNQESFCLYAQKLVENMAPRRRWMDRVGNCPPRFWQIS